MDYTDIIDGHLSNFVKDCLNLFDENNKGISYFPSDFEVFNFGGNKFYEYKHKEKIMETYFRDEMIIATLVDLFGFYKIKFLQGTKIVDYKIIPSDDSLLKFDNTHDFVFVIGKTGYTFTYDCEKNKNLINKYCLEQVLAISFKKKTFNTDNEISFDNFLKKYFLKSLVQYYLKSIEKGLHDINAGCGFKVINVLSMKNLSLFKEKLLKNIDAFDFNNAQYEFKFSDKSNNPCVEDLQRMSGIFKNENLSKVLVGDNEFSKCFVTAEYLFENLKHQNHFDYTSVVCGYFKSIEILICHICSNDNEHKRFARLRDLINLICHNISFWKINYVDIKKFRLVFDDYRMACRNEHLHTDNIYTFKEIERIRKNTWICLFYLLSGFKNPLSQPFSSFDSKYNRLYRALSKIPSHITKFIIEKDGAKMYVLRPYSSKNVTKYDENGNISTPIVFVQVPNFAKNNLDSECNLENCNKIIINEDNLPDLIYWYNDEKGENLINF